jgi:hypothetical protein
MTDLPCPLPQVEAALLPYIRTRQETQQIRATITQAVHAATADHPVHHHLLAYLCDPPDPDPLALQPGGQGALAPLQRAYLAALAGQRRAMERNRMAREDLAAQLDRCGDGDEGDLEGRDEDGEDSYDDEDEDEDDSEGSEEEDEEILTPAHAAARARVAQVRAERKRDRGAALERAARRLALLDDHPARREPKPRAAAAAGAPPEPPSSTSAAAAGEGDAELDETVGRIKRALVQAKVRADAALRERNDARERVGALVAEVPAGARAEALRRARDELVAWMEGELAAIGDGADEDDGGGEEEAAEGVVPKEEVDGQVGERYDRYVEARAALVREVKAAGRERDAVALSSSLASRPKPTRKHSQQNRRSSPAAPAPPPSLSARDLIAFLPAIMQSSRDEAALLQQTAFLRRQLNLAAAETERTVRRLAGESHLVGPDAADVGAWSAASRAAAERTRAFVDEQVGAGSESVGGAREALAGLQAKRAAVEHLKKSMQEKK